MPTEIHCVAFDAVGTLIYPEPSVSQAYWEIGSEFGSQISRDEVRLRFATAFQDLSRGIRDDYSTNEVEERERWRQIVRRVFTDIPEDCGCFEKLHAHFARPAAWRCFPDVIETFEHLLSRGIHICVASNFDERLNTLCDHMPELRPLRRRVVSACIGWYKPSPRFYARLTQDMECPAHQILMVGDDLENDVRAARDAGLQALFLDRQGAPANDVITDLRQLPLRRLVDRRLQPS